MYPFEDIDPSLAREAFGAVQFDLYRLVDPSDHRVFACAPDADGEPRGLEEGTEKCYRIWKRTGPCMNCTSRSCLATDSAMFKIEYLDGRVLLVASVPVEAAGRRLALELAKDMTDSLLVSDGEQHDNIEITQMINRFNDLAVRDAFTQVYNKKFVNNELGDLVRAASRQEGAAQGPALIAELDVNEFKQVNDTYGHSVGDDVLLYFARELKRIAHERDGWVGRIGGDEFLVCVPNGLSDDELRRFLEDVEAVEQRAYETEKGSFTVSASCGACFAREGDTMRTWLDRADAAMYEAKRSPERFRVVR